jgi:hypothetical protein
MRESAFALAAITALSLGFERIDPSIGLSQDLHLTNLSLALMLTLLLWLVSCAASRSWPRVPRTVAIPVLLWLAMLILSAAFAPRFQSQALAFVRDIGLGIAFGWAVYDLAQSPSRQQVLGRALATCGMGVAAIGLAEALGVRPIVDWLAGFRYQPGFNVGEVTRVASTLTHPNIAAVLLALVLPQQLAWSVTARSVWARTALLVGLLLEIAALVLTVSRAGALVGELALGLMLLASVLKHQRLLTRTSLAAAIGLPALLALSIARQPILLLHLTSETVQNWYRADYSPPAQVSVHAGEAALVPVRLANNGDRVWSPSGAYPFALSYHLKQADGTPVTFDGPRTPLPGDVAPGSTLELQAQVVAPQTPGTYLVEWDEVQEHVTWFSWAGSPVGITYLKVGDPVTLSTQPSVIQPTVAPPPPPPVPPARLTQWRAALLMARSRPLLGVGPDNFRWAYGDFAVLDTWDTGGHANSVYFEFLADTGVIGLGLFLWLAWSLLRTSLSGLFDAKLSFSDVVDTRWIWRLACAASLCAWFLHGLLDYFYEPLPTNLEFWLIAGLAMAGAERAGQREPDAAPCASPSI